jgi:DNA invertase Pin-like site-specific DNA recombinase
MKPKNAKKLVAYYRVSTKGQERSGLGLEAQKTAVAEYARQTGGVVIAEYTETETGKTADRPNLAEAIGHTRLSAATLVIAKLDRLARNVHFTSGLMESGVEFVACDNPDANKLTIHLLAAMA